MKTIKSANQTQCDETHTLLTTRPEEHLAIVAELSQQLAIPGIPCYALVLKTCNFQRLIGCLIWKRIAPLLKSNNAICHREFHLYAYL